MQEMLILVDEKDNQIGVCEKMETHRKALLHRAFSILVFNQKNELMLQQRDIKKYHSGGKWTNTCCSHPRDKETLENAIHRRLKEEIGFDTELKEKTEFIYNVKLDNELTEHEYLHVFVGHFDDQPRINQEEAMAYKWISLEDLRNDIESNPDSYTKWFQIIVKEHYNQVFG